jgi:hypothetical protein
VFLVEESKDESCVLCSTSIQDVDVDNTPRLFALKVQVPSAPWEFYILNILSHRFADSPQIQKSIVQPYSCHLLDGESCILLSFGKHGTLLDSVNSSSKNGGFSQGSRGFDEILVAFFSVEIIQCILAVHRVGVCFAFALYQRLYTGMSR